MEEKGIAFEGLAEALAVPRSDLRLFGKPESFVKRRMGVAVANGDNADQARQRAKLAASKVRPVKASARRGSSAAQALDLTGFFSDFLIAVLVALADGKKFVLQRH